jgi:HAD superfamily hydrolase (TIGR01509 family)
MKLEIPERRFGGYIFDCDGTIADSMPLHFRAWTRAMEALGGTYPEALFYQWGGTPAAVVVEQLNARYGLAMDVAEAVRIKDAAYLAILHEVKPVEAVVAIARKFRGSARLAVASGGHRALVEGTLAAIGILDWFDAIVCAEDYRRGKPSPDPFLEAARRLDIDPGDCVVFEDTPTGIEAAKAAGMAWVLVPGG